MRRRLLVAVFGLLLCADPAAASHVLSPLVLTGETAPDTGGGTFQSFGQTYQHALNAAGEAVFTAKVKTGPITQIEGIFLASTSGVSSVVLEGDTAPLAGSPTFTGFGDFIAQSDGGVVVFDGRTTGANGLFTESSGTLTKVAVVGDPVPVAGGTFSSVGAGVPSVNDSGEVAFFANISGGTAASGVFLFSSGTLTKVALEGEAAPAGATGSFSDFELIGPVINASGEIVFAGDTDGGSGDGIFHYASGSLSTVAFKGDPAAGAAGGVTYSTFGMGDQNDAGDVVFQSSTSVGTFGVYLDAGGAQTLEVQGGDATPAGGTHSFLLFGPAMNASQEIAFYDAFVSTVGEGVFLLSAPDEAIAVFGDAAPETGGTFSTLGAPAINDSGEVAFGATHTGPPAGVGIFFAPEPGVVASLASGIGLLGWLARRRRRSAASARNV